MKQPSKTVVQALAGAVVVLMTAFVVIGVARVLVGG